MAAKRKAKKKPLPRKKKVIPKKVSKKAKKAPKKKSSKKQTNTLQEFWIKKGCSQADSLFKTEDEEIAEWYRMKEQFDYERSGRKAYDDDLRIYMNCEA